MPHYSEGLPAQGGRGAGGGGGVCGRCCQRWCGCGGHIVSVSHWCLAAAQCTAAAALRSCASTGHHTPHRHSWSRAAVGTNSVHPFHHNQVHIVPFPIASMADEKTPLNLSSKPPALHLQGPLAPCYRVCMARAVPTRSTGHHCPPQHNYSHLTVLLLRTFGASTDNIDTKESNMSRNVEFVHVAHTI